MVQAGVFERLLGLSRFLGEALSTGQELECADRLELALELDSTQLEKLFTQIQNQSWGDLTDFAEQFRLCCQLALAACDALWAVLDGESPEQCWEAEEALEEARQIYCSTTLDLDELLESGHIPLFA